MTNEEKILEMLASMQKDISSIKEDVTELKEDVAELKEYATETREGVNKVAEWADNAGFLLKIPFSKPASGQ